MKTQIDQRRIDRSEEALEAAFWEFDARRKTKEVGERFAFKQAIRKRFPQWFDSVDQPESHRGYEQA